MGAAASARVLRLLTVRCCSFSCRAAKLALSSLVKVEVNEATVH